MHTQPKEPLLSVVTPIYGYDLDLNALYKRLNKSLSDITENYEVIMVNDCSPDSAWDKICSLSKIDPRIKGINLSRNFGQHLAITAGIHYVKGRWCVIMDCDLQDQPEEIKNLYDKVIEGYDIVMARRVNREDNMSKKLTSTLFYSIFNYLTNQKLNNSIANFGIYSKHVIEEVKRFKEHDRSIGLLINYVGFNKISIDVNHSKSNSDISGYNFRSRLKLAINHIISFSTKPLTVTVFFGLGLTVMSLFFVIYLSIRYYINPSTVSGWTSLLVASLLQFGVVTTIIGIIGLYIGKIHEEVRNRPLYIIRDKTFN